MKSVHWMVAALHKARLEDDMSREEVGERLGRTGWSVRDWEAGRSEPGLTQVEAWAATHGLYLALTPNRPEPAPLAAKAAELLVVVQTRELLRTGQARRIREAAGLSTRDAAGAVGVNAKALHKWEIGKTRPQNATAVLYGRFLLELRRTLALATDEAEAEAS